MFAVSKFYSCAGAWHHAGSDRLFCGGSAELHCVSLQFMFDFDRNFYFLGVFLWSQLVAPLIRRLFCSADNKQKARSIDGRRVSQTNGGQDSSTSSVETRRGDGFSGERCSGVVHFFRGDTARRPDAEFHRVQNGPKNAQKSHF